LETGSYYVPQAGLEPEIHLPQPPECWDYRCVPLCWAPHLTLGRCSFFFSLSLSLFNFWWYWILNSVPCTCMTSVLPLELHPSPFCFSYFFWIKSHGFAWSLSQTALLYLCLPCSWDCRHKPPCPALCSLSNMFDGLLPPQLHVVAGIFHLMCGNSEENSFLFFYIASITQSFTPSPSKEQTT
jgi:hypothetical protein